MYWRLAPRLGVQDPLRLLLIGAAVYALLRLVGVSLLVNITMVGVHSHYLMDFFVIGCLLSAAQAQGRLRLGLGHAGLPLALAGFLVIAVAALFMAGGDFETNWTPRTLPVLFVLLLIWSAAVIAAAAEARGALARLIGGSPVRVAAALSYGGYLIHPMVIRHSDGAYHAIIDATRTVPTLGFALMLAWTRATSLAAAAVLFFVIERPFLMLRRKLAG